MLKKWINKFKKLCSDDYKIESIKKIQLNEDDTLVIKVSQDLPDAAYRRMKDEIEKITGHKKILILENLDIEVIKEKDNHARA